MNNPKKTIVRCCLECLKPLTKPQAVQVEDAATSDGTARPNRKKPGRKPGTQAAKFCSNPCKGAWHNRRKLRGADLYDLFMNQRYNRTEAEDAEVWKEMCRLAEGWNDEDKRDGRTTYDRNPGRVIAALMDKGSLMRARRMRI